MNENKEVSKTILQQTYRLKNSVLGYDEERLGEDLYNTFKSIKNSFEHKRVAISFISFADTELKSDNIDQWIVEPDKGKFFYAPIKNVEDKEELNKKTNIINDYYFFKNVLSETVGKNWLGTEEEKILLSNPKSAQLAYVLDDSFIYRIFADNSITEEVLEYDRDSKVLSIRIPISWLDFRGGTSKQRDYTPLDYDKRTFLYIVRKRTRRNKTANFHYESSKADVLDLQEKTKKLSKILRSKEVPIKDADKSGDDIYAEGFARLILSLAYLSKLLHCWVESIPSVVGFDKKKTRCLGVFIWGYYGDSQTKESPYSIYFQQLADKICACYANKYIQPLQRALQVREEATKSAKAAIMSRNMSHNLGSHVMVYLKQNLCSVGEMVREGVLEDVFSRDAIIEKELPFLVGMGRFLAYLQERQDYIATVATDYVPYPTVVNFKDAIYDELKPELRYERHHKDSGGLQKGLKMSNLLLDYIAYSEGIKSSNQIELWFGDKFMGKGEVDSNLRKLNVALPSGTMGRQAFFSIMENIIRNTAKHEGATIGGKGKLVFRFDILKPEDICAIYDLRFSGKGKLNNVKDAYKNKCNKYVYLGITSVVGTINTDKILQAIEKGLKRDYIAGSRMDDKYRGIKEMRISAAWMRRYNIDTDIPDHEPPALAARVVDGSLQYIICLPKPRKVAFVVSNNTKKEFETVYPFESLDFNDSHIFSLDEIREMIREIADYDLVVIESIRRNKFHELLPNIGARFIISRKDNIKKYIEEIIKGSFVCVYKDWLYKAFEFKDDKSPLPQISVLDPDGAKIKSEGINVQCGDSNQNNVKFFKDCILFKTHYVGQPNLGKSARSLYAQSRFVEAISGGNSTDRLIRRDKRDFVWYAKHVAAGLTKVAVFDERIYSMIMPKGNLEPSYVRKTIQEFFKKNPNKRNKRVWVCSFIEHLVNKLHINEDFAWGKLLNYFNSLDSINIDNVLETLHKHLSIIKEYSNTWKYREMGIWAFNIIIENEVVKIKGYSAPTTDKINSYKEKYEGKVIAVFDKTTLQIKLVDEQDYKFDFITIHQGLLDKVYSALNIGINNKKDRIFITRELHRVFSKIKYKTNNELPQLIIHSGRSKPNNEDMPQKQPFLQFSALDNAIKDCKYTLTELLYSAHYEQ